MQPFVLPAALGSSWRHAFPRVSCSLQSCWLGAQQDSTAAGVHSTPHSSSPCSAHLCHVHVHVQEQLLPHPTPSSISCMQFTSPSTLHNMIGQQPARVPNRTPPHGLLLTEPRPLIEITVLYPGRALFCSSEPTLPGRGVPGRVVRCSSCNEPAHPAAATGDKRSRDADTTRCRRHDTGRDADTP